METIETTQDREITRRGNGSQVYTEPYSEAGMQRLMELVLTFYRQGDRKFYSIHVDGEMVVPKNSDGRKFNRYLQFVNQQTKTVEVRMYQGASPNCNKYVFVKASANVGLRGVDVQQEVEKALEQERLQSELKDLRKELERKNKKLKKLKLQALEEENKGMNQINEIVKNGAVLAGTIKGMFNGGNAAGLSGAEQPTAERVSEVEVEIVEQGVQPEDNSKKKEAIKAKTIYKDLVAAYGEEGLENAMGWLSVLSEHPELQQQIKEYLNSEKTE